MKLDLKEWLAKIVNIVNTHFFTNKTVSFNVTAMGKSYGPNYCNFMFPIPYTPEPYTATISDINIVNVGAGATVANYYAFEKNYIYVRVTRSSGLAVNGIYQATANVTMVVGGVVRKLLKALKPLTLGRGWAV